MKQPDGLPNGSSTEAQRDAQQQIVADALVIGGGFGGCLALHRLREQGLNTKLLEAGADLGGVWFWNRYPGARVDSDTPIYQFSDKAAWRDFNFKEKFPGHAELRTYFDHVDKVYGLRKDAIFNARIVGAEYRDDANEWICSLEDGRIARCTYLVLATGSSIKRHLPMLERQERFKGVAVHSARWPENLDVRGKKVGVIGNGATGVQIIQELAKQDCQLKVFLRTPCTALPMRQRAIPEEESESTKVLYDAIFARCKTSRGAFPHNAHPRSFQEESAEQHEALWDELFRRGSLAILGGNYREVPVDKEANAAFYNYWVRSVRSRIKDAKKRDIVAPLKQLHWIGAKRPPLEMDYYESLDRPNVEIVDLKSTPIERFGESGIITTKDGNSQEHELDIAVFATGYDAMTGSLMDMNMKDRHGTPLQEKWKDGVRTNLGMMIPNMPNAFMVYGPQAPTAFSNGPPFLEMQVDWIDRIIKQTRDEGMNAVETTEEGTDAWVQRHLDFASKALMIEGDSWYMGANIPGKRREPLVYIGGVPDWWSECELAANEGKGLKRSRRQC